MFKDIQTRTEGVIPNGTSIDIGDRLPDGKENLVNFQQALIDYNAPISLTTLDSIFQSDLANANMHTKFVINKINPKTNEILESSNPSFHSLWGTIKTDKMLLCKDETEAIQAIIVSPYKKVFERMGLFLLGTVLVIALVGWSIVYQIKIIITQNKIAELRKNFSNVMIHDLKSPINSMLIGLRTLRSGKIDNQPEKREKHFDIMEDVCEHMLSLSNRFLTMAKIEENKLTLDKVTIPLEPFINELIENFKIRADKDIVFTANYLLAKTVYADKSHLREIISNLIDNAIKYSDKSVNISIVCYSENKQTKIKVSDNGYGIPLKEQSLIFEKFERSSAANKRSLRGGAVGFGIGLSYVQQVMQAHGGTVELESIEGIGSTFTLVFQPLTEEIAQTEELT